MPDPKPLYAFRNRAPGYATAPKDWPWEYVEIPSYMAAQRPDLPITTKHRHGVVTSDVPLTLEQRTAFEIDWINDPDKDTSSVLRRLHRILVYQDHSEWPEEAKEARRLMILLHVLISREGAPIPKEWRKPGQPIEEET